MTIRRFILGAILSAWLLCCLPSARAFALLGPYAPWMTTNMFYHVWDGNIGGPMTLGEEYRWNVPTVTYGFDKSFLDYFGQPGVDAVEAAIQIINDLPPASNIAPTNYPLITRRISYRAQKEGLFNLKFATLPMLLHQMGLSSPTQNVWALRKWDPLACTYFFGNAHGSGIIPSSLFGAFVPEYIDQRNFDPSSQQPSDYVNGTLYASRIYVFTDCTPGYISSFTVDPFAISDTAVCDNTILATPGVYYAYAALTADDIGGLLYLYSRTNINVETLDASIFPDNHTTNSLLRTAPRPGVEKITFVRHTTNFSGDFLTMTNQFTDTYFTNSAQVTQAVQRVTFQPDFLFSAKDIGFVPYNDGVNPGISLRFCQPPDTSGWINNSGLNGNPGGDGPGVIRPQVQITFPTPAKYIAASGGAINGPAYLWNWAAFDGTTNAPLILGPSETNVTSLTLSARTVTTNNPPSLEWMVLGHQGGSYRIDISTNLTDWTEETVMTNINGIFIFNHPLNQPQQYFRAILQ